MKKGDVGSKITSQRKAKGIIIYHAETNKTRCPPASPEGVADGGQAPGALHHVMGRGIDGEKIFKSKVDRNDFLSRLADLCEKGDMIVYAWALMPNHFHLLIRTARQPLSHNKKGDTVASDERILGSSEFVESIMSGAEHRDKETLRLSLKISDLSSLAREIVKRQAIAYAAVRSGNRKKWLVKARKLFSQIAVKKMGYSGAEVARFLGVTTSAVNRLANTEELSDVGRYI